MKKILPILFIPLAFIIGFYAGGWFKEIDVVRAHHGEMNVRVGHPYGDLMKHMNNLAEQNNTNELYTLINKADENSGDIFGAWLYIHNQDSFRTFVYDETKENPNQNVDPTRTTPVD